MYKTALYHIHKTLGAKMVPFGGWEMPIQYHSILEEHKNVREAVGLFDVSHMGEVEVRGKDALSFLNFIITNNLEKIPVGKVLYTCICNDSGGVLDDLLVYRFLDHILLIPNASNKEKIVAWLEEKKSGFLVDLRDLSLEKSLLAIQGPKSEEVLQPLTPIPLHSLSYYSFVEGTIAGVPTLISRTGYTGEDGFELMTKWTDAEPLWNTLLESGVAPVGLGARDLLRLEMGYALYGHELD